MHLHPFTVHFPIALLFAAGGFYVYSLFRDDAFYQRAGGLLHVIALATMVLAIFTGLQADGMLPETERLDMLSQRHELLSFGLIWIYGMLYVWQLLRNSKFAGLEKTAFVVVYCLFLILLSYSAYLGGVMVYEEGAGMVSFEF